jgi:Bacterial aa3 type cytochrome c oxidase subunit IV
MAGDHGAAVSDGMDMEAHEATYDQFIELTQTCTVVVLSIVLLLVLWGLEGHGFLALIGLILTFAAATIGGLTGQGWKAVAPVFLLIGLACIVF